MESLLIFPYFLVKLIARLGVDPGVAEWSGAVLAAVCAVSVMMAPFHPRQLFKTSMAAVSWMIILLASLGCIWECRDAIRAAEQRPALLARPEMELRADERIVDLGEA
jgi:uncharacterized membrane protein YqjE